MPKDTEKVAESKDSPVDEVEKEQPDAKAQDEEEVEGHISQADVWLRGTNNWKRRR